MVHVDGILSLVLFGVIDATSDLSAEFVPRKVTFEGFSLMRKRNLKRHS